MTPQAAGLSAATSPAGGSSSGAIDVTRFDFRRQQRMTPDQIRALHVLYERCARNLSTAFSTYLRTTVLLTARSVESMTYAEFLRTVADPTAYYALGIAPGDELGAIEIHPAVAFALIDRLLGGPAAASLPVRPLTEIEQHVIDSLVKMLLEGLADVWKASANLAFSIRAREARPDMLQVAAPGEVMLVAVFAMQVGEVTGRVAFAIPATVIEQAGAQYTQAWPKPRRDAAASDRAWMVEHVARALVPVDVELRAALPAQTICTLQPGQVVALPVAADAPVGVFVGGIRKLTGHLGAEQGRLVVAVQQIVGRPARAAMVEQR